jgi:SHS2 domain-containing protein
MPRTVRYKLLNYMSDALLESYGRDLGEAFANAAMATTSVMLDLRTISSHRVVEEVEVRGFDKANLLYNWIEAVLLKKEIERKVFRSFEVRVYETSAGYLLKATLTGEHIDPLRHRFKRDVKAVTYHEMKIEDSASRCVVRFLLDL